MDVTPHRFVSRYSDLCWEGDVANFNMRVTALTQNGEMVIISLNSIESFELKNGHHLGTNLRYYVFYETIKILNDKLALLHIKMFSPGEVCDVLGSCKRRSGHY